MEAVGEAVTKVKKQGGVLRLLKYLTTRNETKNHRSTINLQYVLRKKRLLDQLRSDIDPTQKCRIDVDPTIFAIWVH